MAFAENLTGILVEGGSGIASTLLEAGLVNRIYLFLGNQLLGYGAGAIRFRRGLTMEQCITLDHRKSVILENDVYITGIPRFRHC
jgi:diaminohydroxyphosphoribosylaminopyrimidine deaminase / 5-amino-6-(5-phosphoribosylamino)uracil reductase